MRLALLVLLALTPAGAKKDGLFLRLAQEEESFAVTQVRILTGGKGEVEAGTILVKGDKFAAVGKDVKVPPGTRVIDGKGLVAFPGMVNPFSRLGTGDSFGTGGGAATPQYSASDEINPASDIFTLALRTGITTYGIHPAGGTVGGQGAILKPIGLQKETMVLDKGAFLRITLPAGTPAKEALRQALEAAKRQIEAEKKAPPKPAPGKPEEKAPPVVRFLRGEIPALVSLNGPAEMLHFWQILDPFAEFKARIVLLVPYDGWKAAEEAGRRKAQVILRPDLTFAPSTRDRVNPAAEFLRAGATVAFAPGADSGEAAESFLFRVSEMVKYGVPREAALRAVTMAPAEMLGIEKRVGSIEAGKDADFLLLDADPLAAGARLRRVFINGREAYAGD